MLDTPEFAEFASKKLVLVYLDSPHRNPHGKEQRAHNRLVTKSLPFGAVWADFCERYGVPAGQAYLDELASYEKNVTSKRG